MGFLAQNIRKATSGYLAKNISLFSISTQPLTTISKETPQRQNALKSRKKIKGKSVLKFELSDKEDLSPKQSITQTESTTEGAADQ